MKTEFARPARALERGRLFSLSFGIFSFLMLQAFLLNPASGAETDSDTRVGIYFNYYLPGYTNTPLFLKRDCSCELGYQTGITIQERMFWRVWFNLHGYLLGASPGPFQAPEQWGTRLEGHLRFKTVTFHIGHHSEWNVYKSSNFPIESKEGNYMSTGGLRETYVGITWLLY